MDQSKLKIFCRQRGGVQWTMSVHTASGQNYRGKPIPAQLVKTPLWLQEQTTRLSGLVIQLHRGCGLTNLETASFVSIVIGCTLLVWMNSETEVPSFLPETFLSPGGRAEQGMWTKKYMFPDTVYLTHEVFLIISRHLKISTFFDPNLSIPRGLRDNHCEVWVKILNISRTTKWSQLHESVVEHWSLKQEVLKSQLAQY